MSDSDETQKKAEAPSWQAKASDETSKETPEPISPPQAREAVVEQAKRFLEEDEVRDASTEKKITFLESKGLRGDEIQQLLGVTRNTEASAEVGTSIYLASFLSISPNSITGIQTRFSASITSSSSLSTTRPSFPYTNTI